CTTNLKRKKAAGNRYLTVFLAAFPFLNCQSRDHSIIRKYFRKQVSKMLEWMKGLTRPRALKVRL
ncbi:hypothetical protein, partial [Trichococcus palustris]|uniref:hypothetical protein n=1 Tax=Trichococcus palustris TaxID=140314 RepID=UPI001C42ECB0